MDADPVQQLEPCGKVEYRQVCVLPREHDSPHRFRYPVCPECGDNDLSPSDDRPPEWFCHECKVLWSLSDVRPEHGLGSNMKCAKCRCAFGGDEHASCALTIGHTGPHSWEREEIANTGLKPLQTPESPTHCEHGTWLSEDVCLACPQIPGDTDDPRNPPGECGL